jgi:hypothetical protein
MRHQHRVQRDLYRKAFGVCFCFSFALNLFVSSWLRVVGSSEKESIVRSAVLWCHALPRSNGAMCSA